MTTGTESAEPDIIVPSKVPQEGLSTSHETVPWKVAEATDSNTGEPSSSPAVPLVISKTLISTDNPAETAAPVDSNTVLESETASIPESETITIPESETIPQSDSQPVPPNDLTEPPLDSSGNSANAQTSLPAAVGGGTATHRQSKRPILGGNNSNNKKRKIGTSSPVARPQSALPLADPQVVSMVHDLMGLLQIYGPLTLMQLEYNLPPIPRASGTGGAVVWTKTTLDDIVQVLVATGVVQVVQDSDPPQYCMFSGITRADVILPSRIMEELENTYEQMTKTEERVAALKQALLDKVPAKQVLKTLLQEYPEIVNDPVYLAALRNVHVDISTI